MKKLLTLDELSRLKLPAHLRRALEDHVSTRHILRKLAVKLPVAHTIAGVQTFYDESVQLYLATATFNTDGDGAPHCYHPQPGKGLDYLANAGHPGNWWGIYCDPKTGRPVIQKPSDPAPGYYVSTTSIFDPTKKPDDPNRYANAEKLPYIALPAALFDRAKIGDVATVLYNGKSWNAIVADTGGNGSQGEGSIYLGEMLGLPHDPKGSNAPSPHNVHYCVYLNSAQLRADKKAGLLLNNAQIDALVTKTQLARSVKPASYFS